MDTRSEKYQNLSRKEEDVRMYAMPRSGCTCLIQVFNHLFYHPLNGVEIISSHALVTKFDKYLLVTYRDFRDAAVSVWRIGQARSYNEQGRCLSIVSEQDVNWMIGWAKTNATRLRRQKEIAGNNPKVLYLQYEKWVNNFDWLFKTIEEHFNIEIDIEHRNAILDDTNIRKNKERADKVEKERGSVFDEFDKKTKIHSMHVHKGAIGGWVDFIPEKYCRKFNKSLKTELTEWGYKI